MLIIDLPTGAEFQTEIHSYDNYPEEVLNAGWNPVLEQVRALRAKTSAEPRPASDTMDLGAKSS